MKCKCRCCSKEFTVGVDGISITTELDGSEILYNICDDCLLEIWGKIKDDVNLKGGEDDEKV